MEQNTQHFIFKVKALKPFVPILKKYFGLPFVEIELEIMAADHEGERGDDRKIAIPAYVEPGKVKELLDTHFGKDAVSDQIIDTLFLAANIYYGDSVSDYESQQSTSDDYLFFMERTEMREEIAKLYSFIQKRKKQEVSQPIKFVSDKEKVVLDDTAGWLEALLENHLFPNCLPDVKDDQDARRLWDKKGKRGRPERPQVNAIVNGVASYLGDQGVVEGVAPTNLCNFIVEYLKAMGQFRDSTDAAVLTSKWVKAQIHNLAESGPVFYNYNMSDATVEELSTLPPDMKAYQWLFPRKPDMAD